MSSPLSPSQTRIFTNIFCRLDVALGIVELSVLEEGWFAAIIVSFIIFVVTSITMCLFQKSRQYFLWLTSLPMIGFHLIGICAEVSFIVAVYPLYSDLFFVAIAALGSDSVYNSVLASIIYGSIRKKLKNTRNLRFNNWPSLVAFSLSLINATHLNVLLLFSDAIDQDITNTASAMSLNKVLKNLCMVVISVVAINRRTPSIVPLILLVLSGSLLVWDLLLEALKWCIVFCNGEKGEDEAPESFELKTDGKRNSDYTVDIGTKGRRGLAAWKKANNIALIQPGASSTSLQAIQSEEKLATHETFYCRLFACFTLPFVLISFLPHLVSLVAIPLALLSLRRFMTAFDGSDAQYTSNLNSYRLTWFASRGLFLLPFSIVGMTPVFAVFFAVNFVTIVILYALRLLSQIFFCLSGFRESVQVHVNSCHVAYRFVLSCLIWAFLPFFDKPPIVRSDKVHKKRHFLIMCTVIVWFLLNNFALPIVTVVFDFLYSVELLQQAGDPSLPTAERLLLHTLVVVSFLFTTLGLAAFLLRSIFLQILTARKIRVNTQFFTRENASEAIYLLYDFSLDPVPPITDNDAEAERRSKKLNSLFLLVLYLLLGMVSLAQTVIKVFSVSYVGIADNVWIITLTVSVLSLSLTISVQLTKVAVGRAPGWLKFTINAWLFAIIAAVLAVLCARFTSSRFCNIPKTLQQSVELSQIENCNSIGFDLVLFDVTDAQNLTFYATSILGFNITENPDLVELDLVSLGVINDTFSVTNNPALSTLNLVNLENITTGVTVTVAGNPVLASFTANQLNLINGTFLADGNAFTPDFALPTLTNVVGFFSLSNNHQAVALHFPGMQDLTGTMRVATSNLSNVDLSALATPASQSVMEFVDNQVSSLVFAAMLIQNGELTIQGNTYLSDIAFVKLQQISGDVTITENPDLTNLDLSQLDEHDGNLIIANNTALTSLSFPSLATIGAAAIISIQNNPKLRSISLPFLTSFEGQFSALNNPNLVTVIVPSATSFVASSFIGSNANLTFVFV